MIDECQTIYSFDILYQKLFSKLFFLQEVNISVQNHLSIMQENIKI